MLSPPIPMMKELLCVGSMLLVVLTSGFASGNDEGSARKLFSDGVGLMGKGSFAEALDRFERAYELWANPKILLNIATTLRQLGRLHEAANAYQEYLNDEQADPVRIPEVKQALEEIDQKVSVLEIEINTPGASVSLHGKDSQRDRRGGAGFMKKLGEADPRQTWTVRVSPGEHLLSVSKEGFQTHSELLVLAAGEARKLNVTLDSGVEEKPVQVDPLPVNTEEPVTAPVNLSHSGQISFFLRSDVDGKFRGVVGAAGLGYGLGSVLELQVGALIGRDKGLEPGALLYLSEGMFKPMVYVGAPMFFVDGMSPGVRGALGLTMNPSPHIGIFAQGGAATFFSVPENRESTAIVLSAGVQGRL